MTDEFVSIGVKVSNAEILEKLDILRLECGISSNSFIIQAIAEKLQREGYLQNGIADHERRVNAGKPRSDIDNLLESLRKIKMTRR